MNVSRIMGTSAKWTMTDLIGKSSKWLGLPHRRGHEPTSDVGGGLGLALADHI